MREPSCPKCSACRYRVRHYLGPASLDPEVAELRVAVECLICETYWVFNY